MRYVIAIDIGTGACRAVCLTLDGRVVARGFREVRHAEDGLDPSRPTFEPDSVWDGVIDCVQQLTRTLAFDASDEVVVTATSVREGVVLFDERMVDLWGFANDDLRAGQEIADLTAAGHAREIRDLAGDGLALSAVSRLRWLIRVQPAVFNRIRHISMICDWAVWRLTGQLVSVASAASSSGLYDTFRRRWSPHLASLAGISTDVLPEIAPEGTAVGHILPAAATALGLPPTSMVVAVGTDTHTAALGSGAVSEGELVVVGGSFWQQLCTTAAPIADPERRLRTLCHLLPGQWLLEATGFYSGLALRWFRDTLMGDSPDLDARSYRRMAALASAVPVGAAGVIAVVSGLQEEQGWPRLPVSLMGFDLTQARTTVRGECIRAIMESAVYVTMGHVAMIEACANRELAMIRFTGGGSQARLWCQMIADATGKRVVVPINSEASAVGAAVLGGFGAGWFTSVKEGTGAMVTVGAEYEPDRSLRDTYERLHDRWRIICESVTTAAAAWT